MGPYITQATIFLIQVIFGLYIIAILLRYLLAKVRADFYNPLSQFIVNITNPPLKPLRRLIPNYLGIDWPLIILLILIQGLEICLTTLVAKMQLPTMIGLLVLIVAHVLKQLIYIYIFILIVQAIMSWFSPNNYNPATIIMHQLSEPLLKLVRRFIPPAGGFDWSVLVIVIALNLMLILLVAPLMHTGYELSLS